MMLKPEPFALKKKGSPEQISKEWEYGGHRGCGRHAIPEVAYNPCCMYKIKEHAEGRWAENITLFDCVGAVKDGHSWKEALVSAFN